MECPVNHVGRGEDNYRLYFTVGVITFLAISNKFLMVIRTIYIESPVVFQSCGVGTEHAWADWVPIARCLIIRGGGRLGI